MRPAMWRRAWCPGQAPGSLQLAPHFKLIGELVTGASTSNIGGVGDGFLGFYGLRITGPVAALNIGVATPFGGGGVNLDGPGLFFVSLTGRAI